MGRTCRQDRAVEVRKIQLDLDRVGVRGSARSVMDICWWRAVRGVYKPRTKTETITWGATLEQKEESARKIILGSGEGNCPKKRGGTTNFHRASRTTAKERKE